MRSSLKLSSALICLVFLAGCSAEAIQPGEAGVLTRFGAPVDVKGPGVHRMIPYVQEMAHISLRDQSTRLLIDAPLADGSSCPVTVDIITAVAKPTKAYLWRRDHGHPLSEEGGVQVEHTVAPATFEKAVREKMGQVSEEAAAGGALSDWINAHDRHERWRVYYDGTSVARAVVRDVVCEKPREAVPPPALAPFQAPMTASPLDLAPPAGATVVETPPIQQRIRSTDGHDLRLDGLVLRVAVIDAAALGKLNGRALEDVARERAKQILMTVLRRRLGSRSTAEIRALDLTTLINAPDAPLSALLAKSGLGALELDVSSATISAGGE